MAYTPFPDSLPLESLPYSQRNDYVYEATQLSQPVFSQTQNTQGTFYNSQVEPRRKYWAIFISTNDAHSILKIPWTKSFLQIGRGPHGIAGNDVVLPEKRISNRHCRVTLGNQGVNGSGTSVNSVQQWKDGETDPEVWIEDLGSSNGTFVNGLRITTRRLLQHGDEVSLGCAGTLENHDVRYIYRSVGPKGSRTGGPNGPQLVGEVYERYQILNQLGKGSFGEVRKAVDVETGDLRAIKQIVKHRFQTDPKALDLCRREIEITSSLHHENLCRLIEWFEDPQHICLVLEYIDGGDLLDYILKYPNEMGLPEEHAAMLTLQICRGMAYTHSRGVAHRDLKPDNILLMRETPDSPVVIKIADFGLAKMVNAKTMLTSLVGTPQYLAPEVVMQDKRNPGYENVVDSWSIGIIVYSMLTKSMPFAEEGDQPLERIRARFTQPFDVDLLFERGISDRAIDFISRLLEKKPSDRMTMAQALDHPWLAGPASQDSQDSPLVLGGDSVWSIESFEGDSDSEDNDNQLEWSRPRTVSGTNLDSNLAGRSHVVDSDESFSQPLHNLHLHAPEVRYEIPLLNNRQQSSPPSPPLTDDRMSDKPFVPETNGESSHLPFDHDITSNIGAQLNPEQALPTPLEEPIATFGEQGRNKRKIGNELARRTDDFFSSGSLSPPPDMNEIDHINGDKVDVEEEAKTPDVDHMLEIKTPRSTKKSVGSPFTSAKKGKGKSVTTTSIGEGTRTTRSSTRARKSMRLS